MKSLIPLALAGLLLGHPTLASDTMSAAEEECLAFGLNKMPRQFSPTSLQAVTAPPTADVEDIITVTVIGNLGAVPTSKSWGCGIKRGKVYLVETKFDAATEQREAEARGSRKDAVDDAKALCEAETVRSAVPQANFIKRSIDLTESKSVSEQPSSAIKFTGIVIGSQLGKAYVATFMCEVDGDTAKVRDVISN